MRFIIFIWRNRNQIVKKFLRRESHTNYVNLNRYFVERIIRFYKVNKRNFFWRESSITPFQITIIELFLKKTRAENVQKYGYDFIKKYNNNLILFNSVDKEILKLIKPLGLSNQRAITLRKITNYLHENYNDKVPTNFVELKEIPYIGDYTASAIMCFAYNKRYPILDVNSSRIISRFFLIQNKKDIRNDSLLKQKSLELLPRKKIKDYNWGLLDLGAMICKKNPKCQNCFLRRKCRYFILNLNKEKA